MISVTFSSGAATSREAAAPEEPARAARQTGVPDGGAAMPVRSPPTLTWAPRLCHSCSRPPSVWLLRLENASLNSARLTWPERSVSTARSICSASRGPKPCCSSAARSSTTSIWPEPSASSWRNSCSVARGWSGGGASVAMLAWFC